MLSSFFPDLQKCSVLNTVNENANIQLSTISNSNFTAGSTWPNMQCAWRISAPKKQQIKLTFTDFKLHNDCQKAYIQIFDGATSKRGKFCGPDKPWAIFSTSGFLLVKLFVSGISKMLRFTGVYEAVTSGTLIFLFVSNVSYTFYGVGVSGAIFLAVPLEEYLLYLVFSKRCLLFQSAVFCL